LFFARWAVAATALDPKQVTHSRSSFTRQICDHLEGRDLEWVAVQMWSGREVEISDKTKVTVVHHLEVSRLAATP